MKPTLTCEWITVKSVLGQKCQAETTEELLSMKSIKEIFEFRANLLIRKTAYELGLAFEEMHPIDAWNSVQVFYVHNLAVSYGELFVV